VCSLTRDHVDSKPEQSRDTKRFLNTISKGTRLCLHIREFQTRLSAWELAPLSHEPGWTMHARGALTVLPLCPFVEGYIRKHPEDLGRVEASNR
jgi:hypothetical protein